MIKVLLVDDEYLVCSFLKNLIVWEEYGFYIAGQASNGQQALNIVPEIQPDLVFLDVSMPSMDGVEVLRILRRQYPHIKVVMLSSYSDYDYVRETMKIGVVDYLLKHELDAETLVNLLSGLDFTPDDKKTTPVEAQKRDAHPFQVLRDSRTRSFLERHLHEVPQSLRGLKNIIPVAAKLKMSLIETSPEDGVPHEIYLMQQILSTCVQISNQQDQTKVVLLHDTTIVFLFQARSQEILADQAFRVDHCMRIIHDALLKYHNTYIEWKTGEFCPAPDRLPHEYLRIAELFHTQSGDPVKKEYTARLTIEQERLLILSVLGKSPDSLRESLAGIFQNLLNKNILDTELALLSGDLLSLGVKLYQENGIPFPQFGEQKIVKMDTEQIYAYFTQLFIYLINTIKQSEAYSKTVMSIINYVEENYAQEFGLPDLAAHCNLNPSYLSTIFKKETGVSLIQYINRVRIYAAGKLMLMESITPTQVYEYVGFRNYNNFFNLFKSITGMAPKQFKEEATVEWISSFDPLKRQKLQREFEI